MAQGATRTLERLADTEDALDEKLDKESSAVAAKKLATGFDIELTGAVSGIACGHLCVRTACADCNTCMCCNLYAV